MVSGTETARPRPVYSGAHGHSSDSALGMGCMVGRVVPASLYRARPPTKSDRTSEDAEKPADTDIQGENAAKKLLTGGATGINIYHLQLLLKTFRT